jgi:hypothetical protein
MMEIINRLLEGLQDGQVTDAIVGLHWTAVVVNAGGERRCGLASTLFAGHAHRQERQPDVPQAGELTRLPGRELAQFALSESPTMASLGVAALNALLPPLPDAWSEANAEDLLAQYGAGQRVVMVGHFPFVPRLRPRVGELLVLEQDPGPDDLPAEAASLVLPSAQVVAITAMTLANHTLPDLLAMCPPQAFIILLGPSTPLSPLLFDYGIEVLSGAVVTDIEAVLRTAAQGGNFRQLHRAGVRLVNMLRPL